MPLFKHVESALQRQRAEEKPIYVAQDGRKFDLTSNLGFEGFLPTREVLEAKLISESLEADMEVIQSIRTMQNQVSDVDTSTIKDDYGQIRIQQDDYQPSQDAVKKLVSHGLNFQDGKIVSLSNEGLGDVWDWIVETLKKWWDRLFKDDSKGGFAAKIKEIERDQENIQKRIGQTLDFARQVNQLGADIGKAIEEKKLDHTFETMMRAASGSHAIRLLIKDEKDLDANTLKALFEDYGKKVFAEAKENIDNLNRIVTFTRETVLKEINEVAKKSNEEQLKFIEEYKLPENSALTETVDGIEWVATDLSYLSKQFLYCYDEEKKKFVFETKILHDEEMADVAKDPMRHFLNQLVDNDDYGDGKEEMIVAFFKTNAVVFEEIGKDIERTGSEIKEARKVYQAFANDILQFQKNLESLSEEEKKGPLSSFTKDLVAMLLGLSGFYFNTLREYGHELTTFYNIINVDPKRQLAGSNAFEDYQTAP